MLMPLLLLSILQCLFKDAVTPERSAGSQLTIEEAQKDNPVKAVEDMVSFAIMKAGVMLSFYNRRRQLVPSTQLIRLESRLPVVYFVACRLHEERELRPSTESVMDS